MSPKDVETDFQKAAMKDVVNFNGPIVGSEMLQELLTIPQLWKQLKRRRVMNQERLQSKFAMRTHMPFCGILGRSDIFASELHREAAKTLLGQP